MLAHVVGAHLLLGKGVRALPVLANEVRAGDADESERQLVGDLQCQR
jgi:hypothetical protein